MRFGFKNGDVQVTVGGGVTADEAAANLAAGNYTDTLTPEGDQFAQDGEIDATAWERDEDSDTED